MKLLLIHSDYIEFKTKEKTKMAEEIPKEMQSGRMEETLVVFTAVEKSDEGDEKKKESLVKNATMAVKDVAFKVKTNRIVVYPYAHLSSSLSDPKTGKEVLVKFASTLKDEGFDVLRAPFGWYKAFTISCKGHPLSELSKTISATPDSCGTAIEVSGNVPLKLEQAKEASELKKEVVSESLKMEDTLKPRFYILTADGMLHDPEKFDYTGHDRLKKFANYEIKKDRIYSEEPVHIKLMREHELVDFEPGTDGGNFRWYPKGRLIKKLIERYITQVCTRYGGMEVETPIMYDYEHPALKKYLNRFPARQYVVKSDVKEYFLRFAACFGQFLMTHDMNISYRNLPMKMFEITKYSFRREKSGELCGIKRLRTFTMPDMHTIVKDMQMAKEEFARQYDLSRAWMDGIGLEYEAAFRILTEFYNENKEFYQEMVRKLGRPVLIEMFDKRYAYFITKFEFNVVDPQSKAAALSTVQIDVENAETYDLTFVDTDGTRKRPILMHTSVSGSVERNVYAILEREGERIAKGKNPEFPFWLAPTQIRLMPTADEFLPDCEKLADEIENKTGARVDIDDRSEKVGRKIRDAGKDWVNFQIVYGKKEKESGKLPVRMQDGTQKEFTLDELVKETIDRIGDHPKEPLPLPRMMSKRPVFRG